MLDSATINKLMAYEDLTLNAIRISYSFKIWVWQILDKKVNNDPVLLKKAYRCPMEMTFIYHISYR